MSKNDKDNYDWLANFSSAGKDFYNLDHDGHIDAFEAGMMMSDMEEEEREFEREYTPPPSGSKPQGRGCFLASGWFWVLFILYELFEMYCKWKY